MKYIHVDLPNIKIPLELEFVEITNGSFMMVYTLKNGKKVSARYTTDVYPAKYSHQFTAYPRDFDVIKSTLEQMVNLIDNVIETEYYVARGVPTNTIASLQSRINSDMKYKCGVLYRVYTKIPSRFKKAINDLFGTSFDPYWLNRKPELVDEYTLPTIYQECIVECKLHEMNK